MFKKIISGLLLVFFCNLNFVYAQNWVTIVAENGKSADLDLDSIEMVVDNVEYDIKTTLMILSMLTGFLLICTRRVCQALL